MLIKFCGMTRAKDYLFASELGAGYAGFIFHPASPRAISPEAAYAITSQGGSGAPLNVGVFVDADVETIRSTANIAGLDVIQLHGNETPEMARRVSSATGLPYWKVIRLKEEKDLEAFSLFDTDVFLIDAFQEGVPGGTGKSIDLGLVKLALDAAASLGKQIIVAGGLAPHNVLSVLKMNPTGIDLNSGVEVSPGVKDHEAMKSVMKIFIPFSAESPLTLF
jgi:phosphoribosylanthranilate isomerase